MINQGKFSHTRSLIAHFMAELIFKSLKENEKNEDMFLFLEKSIMTLQKTDGIDLYLFLIKFMMFFSKYIGYGVIHCEELSKQLKEYDQCIQITHEEKQLILKISTESSFNLTIIESVSPVLALNIVEKLLVFYQIHNSSINNFKSYNVLYQLENY